MKKIDVIMEKLTGRHILDAMAEVFRQHDEEFRKDEILRNNAEAVLRDALSGDLTPSLDEYIEAVEKDVITRIICAGYNGFQINLANFHAPYGVDFTRMEAFDIAKEHLISNLPTNAGTGKITYAFFQALPEELRDYERNISEYYTHFECAGPKLAHYAGYIIANHLLPWIQPGYRPDPVQTLQYTSWIEGYCNYIPL
jgi:hypothetical protein